MHSEMQTSCSAGVGKGRRSVCNIMLHCYIIGDRPTPDKSPCLNSSLNAENQSPDLHSEQDEKYSRFRGPAIEQPAMSLI